MFQAREQQPLSVYQRIWSTITLDPYKELLKVVVQMLCFLRRFMGARAVGPYEVLHFAHTLELCDTKGHKAIYRKRETIRFTQDYVTSYLDRAWGKGEIFADYQCNPGVVVDRYRCGHGYCVLISLREIKRTNDILHISIDRTVRHGFNFRTCWSETTIRHKTHHIRLAIIFPKDRLPKMMSLLEANTDRTWPVRSVNTITLPDGRREVFWETDKPRLYETYTFKWTW